MLRDRLAQLVSAAIESSIAAGKLPPAVRDVPVEIIDTKQPEHGDFACNFALAASKIAGENPRVIGEMIRAELLSPSMLPRADNMTAEGDPITSDSFNPFVEIEIAGPGFINFRLKPEYVASFLGSKPAKPSSGLRFNVEFVSVNPNGPITVGSGRGAAYGDTLCRVLCEAGNEVWREYYINDGVNSEQMRLFAESVKAFSEGRELPDKGYRGEYVLDVARIVKSGLGDERPDIAWYQDRSQDLMLAQQRADLEQFGTPFDVWFSEQSLHNDGSVAASVQGLIDRGLADEEPHRFKVKYDKQGRIKEAEREDQPVEEEDDEFGETAMPESKGTGKTLWLRSTKFGDDQDRVLRRRDGRLTYIASDLAYHKDKFNRPPKADKLFTVLGPDHHGYIHRLHAVVSSLFLRELQRPASEPLSEEEAKIYGSALERDACRAAVAESYQKLEIVIFQIVRFLKDGKPAPMRKRDGNIYELRDLISELGQASSPNGSAEEQTRIGRDVARFFYLMRSHDSPMDFDIDLATKQSDDNPVFYSQYAHARICSVIEKAGQAGETEPNLNLLAHPKESALIKKILDLDWEIMRCAEDYGVHRLTTYAIELARTFHHFYDACRVIQSEAPELTAARLELCRATRTTLRRTLDLLGVSAPERMERQSAA